MHKVNLIIGIAIFAIFSMLVTNVVQGAFSQTISDNNTKKDTMGNFINYTTSPPSSNNNNLSKDYPTNSSL